MQSEQRSKRKEEVNARKGGGCRASPTKGEGQMAPSSLTPNWRLVWFKAQDFLSSLREGSTSALPAISAIQKGGVGGAVALTSQKRSQAHRETESLEVTLQMKNMAGEWPGLLGCAPSSSSCCFCGPHCLQEAAEIGLGKRWFPPRACQV